MRTYKEIQDELNDIWDQMFVLEQHFTKLQSQETRLRKERDELEAEQKARRRRMQTVVNPDTATPHDTPDLTTGVSHVYEDHVK